ncbi:MAG: nucleotidyl transferase AbiEii/AbiGii toxin family protein [Elusimicrobiales bacterium]|jgi:predicted nucleotidyltransferase component of viral defense system|nr:nucleotidyl transferase AbiEii/AbiGii toxin family protein [Elusimicrobiales bacterium]NLH39997.1 nucleotidyl transferase AbiEii/AbiGii toxin family protein [Elusimicrobiota bacterium]
MIELIKQQFTADMSLEKKVNITREFLQIMAIKFLSDNNIFEHIAFVGGTALRIIYGLRRFSEDLDFSVSNPNNYDFEKIVYCVVNGFHLNGLDALASKKNGKTINSVFIKFSGLPLMLGLSGHKEQNISIKIEVDVNPPDGWLVKNSVVNKKYIFAVCHYDISSMFAGKIHSCIARRYTKGRDIYDLLWYLTKRIKPNYNMLNNAIKQTSGKNPHLNDNNIADFLIEKLSNVDMIMAIKDVERFLEDKTELNLFKKEILINTIKECFEK